MPVVQGVRRGTPDSYPLNLDSAQNLHVTLSGDAHAAGGIVVRDAWEVATLSYSVTQNDYRVTVPAGYEYEVLWVWVEYTSDGNAGNRQLEVSLLSATNDEIGSVLVSTTQGAGLVRFYMLAPALVDLAAFRDTAWLMTPLPSTLLLSAGQGVRIFDNSAISPADSMEIRVQVRRRPV